MSDCQKSTAPPAPPPNLSELTAADEPGPPEPDLPALREVYASQLRQEERDKLEGLCESVLELTREATVIVREIPHGGIDDDLRAAVVDLRHLERYLRITGAQEGNCLERWESRLADAAERLAPRAGEIAAEIEAAIAAAEAAE